MAPNVEKRPDPRPGSHLLRHHAAAAETFNLCQPGTDLAEVGSSILLLRCASCLLVQGGIGCAAILPSNRPPCHCLGTWSCHSPATFWQVPPTPTIPPSPSSSAGSLHCGKPLLVSLDTTPPAVTMVSKREGLLSRTVLPPTPTPLPGAPSHASLVPALQNPVRQLQPCPRC